ncbi:MAG: HAMP domain-containing histidine kinase [Chloroflexi bacterium]|nr:MAG: HAMP domain-containing histidine kinase [Chloroflexota bacterium]
MSDLLLVFQLAIELAFSLLAIKAIASSVRQPDRPHGHLALALGSLALLILLAPEVASSQVLTDVGIVLFLLSGYGLIMFRNALVPFDPAARRLITVAIIAAGIVAVAARLPADPTSPHSALQTFALAALLAVWAFCILEPITRFVMSARGRPAVERARLRAMSLGYAALLAVVLIGTIGGSLTPGATLLIDVIALAVVPILYVAFFPPAWLRRIWRQPEEDQLRHALHDLLLYSPDRATLARRALAWAERLVGGEAAFLVDFDGAVLAAHNVTTADAEKIASANDVLRPISNGPAPWRNISGRLTPLFGDEELWRLRQYGTSINAGLDRVAMNERIAALERAKTDFLNIASHELRGPMTVIKGYLTMLDAGALGEVSPKAQSVLPLLISKSDEVNWMIEQMIEASRLEEGRLALKKQRTDIVELTENAIDGVRMLLSGHELKVQTPSTSIDAEVDPDRFQIVVRNLLSNASKYSPAGTDITVDIHRNGEKATVSVIDQGMGIAAEDQSHLFSRFVRIETGGHVKGTGLGLWLSREIARMHGGDLSVDSAVGQGSTFTFTVPLSNHSGRS